MLQNIHSSLSFYSSLMHPSFAPCFHSVPASHPTFFLSLSSHIFSSSSIHSPLYLVFLFSLPIPTLYHFIYLTPLLSQSPIPLSLFLSSSSPFCPSFILFSPLPIPLSYVHNTWAGAGAREQLLPCNPADQRGFEN